MEIRHLQTFKTIVEQGGFAKAAQHLGYAQSTVTGHIQALETELEGPIFDRLGKRISLTELGHSFFPYANEMLRLHKIAKTLNQSFDLPKGTLTIGATESLTVYRLPDILMGYKEKYPHVNLSVRIGDYRQLQDFLNKGEIDIALILDSKGINNNELFHAEKLIEEEMVVISSINDVGQNTALYTEKGCAYRWIFERFIKEQGLDVFSPFHEFSSLEAIKQCVMCGLGIALVPKITVTQELKEQKLKACLLDMKYGSVSTYLTYRKDKWISPLINYFIEEVNQYFFKKTNL